ncbi:MAG TPA: nuclear transport factor 2 family protein [Blastocatellia bacterium]|nr:nuclear transport factor 2 family protein [Blastocatellia bacterium]
MKKVIFMIIAFAMVWPVATRAQSNTEKEAVKQAVLDYVEGIYEVDHKRIERSVHPELAKRGFYVKKGETAYTGTPMTFAQLVELAKTYNKGGRVPKDAPKEVVIYDVLDQTASAKLTAVWGIDYMHLAKYDGKWMIVNILWQTTPPKP